MKKVFICLAALFFISANLKAQRLFFLFGHAEYASPLGDLKDLHDKGLGVEAGLGIGMNKTFFTGTLGYTWLMAANDNVSNTVGQLRYAPFKLGIRRYVFRKNIFIKADAGLANLKYTKSGGSSSKFTGGIGAGVKFTGLEVLGDFTTVSGGVGSWVSLKAGFTLGL